MAATRTRSFSAASNVTGLKTDVPRVTSILKHHGALSFWDYAAAAPYVRIDMNDHSPLDAVFMSPHKFIGGPGTPGVLIVKEGVVNNAVPATVGGGTVTYVTPEDHHYVANAERREEAGTPGVVESIRAGLVFKLQGDVGFEEIARRENAFVSRAIARLSQCENLEILGPLDAPRLSILSLRFKLGDKDLHYGYVVSLLNDLFGIQARGGCSCAGPYGHALLGMDMNYSRAIQSEMAAGNVILRPGWVRLNFNYFISESEFDYLLGAIELVAQHAWRVLPYYDFDIASGVWRFQDEVRSLPVSLEDLAFDQLESKTKALPLPWDLGDLLVQAERVMTTLKPKQPETTFHLSGEAERLRWFALP